MRRWHSPREHTVMFRRWKQEMRLHGYDWRNPPDPKCDRHVCHCAAGIGSMRKRTPLDCGRARCMSCHSEKLLAPKGREDRRRAIRAEFDAEGC